MGRMQHKANFLRGSAFGWDLEFSFSLTGSLIEEKRISRDAKVSYLS